MHEKIYGKEKEETYVKKDEYKIKDRYEPTCGHTTILQEHYKKILKEAGKEYKKR